MRDFLGRDGARGDTPRDEIFANYRPGEVAGPVCATFFRADTSRWTKALADRDGGLVFDADNQKLEEYLDRWLNDSVRGSVKPVTFESYAQLVRVHIVPALGGVTLRALSPAHLQGFYRAKLDAGLSPRTVQYLHAVLHRALKQALRWGLVPRNVSEDVDPPRVRREEIKALSPDQARTLLETARDDRLEALYVLAVHCGLRQGELLGLKWEDVDLERGTLQVRRTLSGSTFTTPKTAKSRRSVRLTKSTLEALRKHLERQLGEIDRGWSALAGKRPHIRYGERKAPKPS
jgi:integrase